MDELVSCRVLKVYLSGGEPLLVAEAPAYVARLREAGAAVRVTTNGTLVDSSLAREFARARLSAAEVSVQPGAEDACARGVRHLTEAGVRTLVRAVVTLESAGRLEDVVKRFADSGVESIAFQEVMPLGRASDDLASGAMTPERMRGVRDEVARLASEYGASFVSLASTTLADAEFGHPVPCSLGRGAWKSCEIRPDGTVLPCTPAAAFGVTNSVYEKGLARCWLDLPGLYARFADDAPGGVCASCASREACRGGCRAICHLLDGPRGGNPACRFFCPG